MADPGCAEPLFVSLRTTAALTGNNDDAFSQLLHHLNAILNVRAAGGSTASEMYRAAVGELHECIGRNERNMYGDAKNIAFLNFAKSFAALSDPIANNLFDPLSLHCATASEASPSSAPPRLHPISRDIYRMLHDEREYEQDHGLVDFSVDNSLDDEPISRRPALLSPHYRTSSPTYDTDGREDMGEERDTDPLKAINHHDSMISTLFGPSAGAKVSSRTKPPPAKKQKKDKEPPELDVCPHCTYQSACGAHVTKHVRIDHPQHWLDFATVSCRSCDYRCRSSHTLRKHGKAIHGDTWAQWTSQCRLKFPVDTKCPFCDEPVTDIHALCMHVIKYHLEDLSKEDPYIGCDACDETFNWAADLYAHWTRQHSPCPGYVKIRQLKGKKPDGNLVVTKKDSAVDVTQS